MPNCPCKWISAIALAVVLLSPLRAVMAQAPELSVIPMPAAAETRLLLVHQHEADAGELHAILATPDGQFWAQADSFRAWSIQLPDTVPRHAMDADWFPLSAVAALDYRFDAAAQALWLNSSRVARVASLLDLTERTQSTAGASDEMGGHFNLDLQALHTAADNSISGTGDLGVFNAIGYGNLSYIGSRDGFVRLDTNWNHDSPDRLERLTLGDSIRPSSTFGRALRYGGIQWGTEFSLQPNLVTFPQPNLRGTAALPSSVDVYVNQSLRTQREIPAGPFELNQVPVTAGSGEVQVVVTDLLGRSQVMRYPFYAAPRLLKSGLMEYNVQAGWLRENYGLNSADYGSGFAAATQRNGLESGLTSELNIEASRTGQLLGVGMAGLWQSSGSWNLGLATSNHHGHYGAQATGLLEVQSGHWSTGMELRSSTSSYAALTEIPGLLKNSLNLHVGVAMGAQGSASLNHLLRQQRGMADTQISTVGYARRLPGDWYFSAGMTRVDAQASDYSVSVGLTHHFGSGVSAAFQHDRNEGHGISRVSIQQDTPSLLGHAYGLSVERGSYERESGRFKWGTEQGVVTLDAERFNGQENLRGGLASGLAFMGGDVFWTRPVNGSFAVVDAGGVSGARIYRDNHLAGTTDKNGLLLIPDLRAYQPNMLRVEDADVPIEYLARSMNMEVAPSAQSGIRTTFQLEGTKMLQARLLLTPETYVPMGATVEVDGQAAEFPVALDGLIYLNTSAGNHELRARWNGQACSVSLIVPTQIAQALEPAEWICRETRP